MTRPQETSAPAKGDRGGQCARTACTNPEEGFFHPALRWFYCGTCAGRVNEHAGQCVIQPPSESQS